MSVIDTADKVFLVLLWVDTPRPSDDTDITLRDRISSDLEGSETILDLTHRIKSVHLSTLDGRFSSDITFRQSFIRRTKYALPWTPPELRQK